VVAYAIRTAASIKPPTFSSGALIVDMKGLHSLQVLHPRELPIDPRVGPNQKGAHEGEPETRERDFPKHLRIILGREEGHQKAQTRKIHPTPHSCVKYSAKRLIES
jgi:hypothetical protein